MDQYGDGEEAVMDKVFNCTHVPAGKISFRGFTQELFAGMCVLAGCDFLSSIIGIGIKRAHSLVSKYKNLDRVLSVLQFDKKHRIPEDYINSFKKANAVFCHARVYDANMRCLSFLRPLPEGVLEAFEGNLDFLGPDLPPSMVIAIAEGRMDPISMEAFDEFQEVPSQGHQLISTSERLASWNQSRRLHTENDSSPFILFSQKAKNEVSFGAEKKGSQNLKHASYKMQVNKDQELELLHDEVAETNCLLPRQEACPFDRAIMTHFRLVAEHSSLKKASLPIDHNDGIEMDNNAGVLDVKGQKRVFPPIPENNPFKRSKLVDSDSLGRSLSKSLLQKSSHTDSTATHLCEESRIQGEGTIRDYTLKHTISNTQLDINEHELASPMDMGGPEAVSHTLDVSNGTQVMKRTVLAPTTQPCISRGQALNTEAPLVSKVSSTPSSERSFHIKPKTNTQGNKSLPPKSSGITKFFTRI